MSEASGEQQPASSALDLPYQTLVARYSSNFAVEWQLLGLGLTAQGFVVAASSGVEDRKLTAISLAAVILFIGAVTIISSLHAGLYSRIDRVMLDEYEKMFLTGNLEKFRLLHSVPYHIRESRAPGRIGTSQNRLENYIMRKAVRPVGPMRWWIALEIAISVSGASVPILGIFGL